MVNRPDLHVVLGASGALGSAVVRQLASRGRRIRAVNRSGRLEVPEGVEVERADGTDPVSIRRACEDAAVVFHCINVPFADWPRQFPPVTNAVIDGAASAGARLVFGDNLYMYGSVKGLVTEGLRYRATGPKGRTRAAMARAIIEAHRDGRIRATIGRASDFYGPGVTHSLLGERVFPAALAGGSAEVLGDVDVPHTYTFIDDFAAALVTLGDQDEALGRVWHVPSAETVTTRHLLTLIFAEAGTPLRFRTARKWMVTLGGLVNPMMRELHEVYDIYRDPFIVDHATFARSFGVRTTPHPDAVRVTLDWYRHRATTSRISEAYS